MITLAHVNKIYQIDGEEFYALRDINLEIKQGEFTAILGPSGCGKSTLMHIIGLLDTPTSGKLLINNKDATKLDDNELHLIVGAGAAEGSMDAGNILKPSLARGRIQMIGATTTDEYTRYVEKDAALERRFQPVQVPEATLGETVAILKGLRKYYEEFHGVKVPDEVLADTVQFARR